MNYKPHITLTHRRFTTSVTENDLVIDATCGNGHDTLKLATLASHVYALDIQQAAITSTRERTASFKNISFYHQCHSEFPETILPETIKLIVYNLGYLPGSDKRITTSVSTTIESLKKACDLIMPTGLISITCYPGHDEGMREEEELLYFCKTLDTNKWSCVHNRWINRELAPSVLFLEKKS